MINLYKRTPENTVHSAWATNTHRLFAEIKHWFFFTLLSSSNMPYSSLAFLTWKDKRYTSRIIKAFRMEKSLIFIVSITSNYHAIIFIPTVKNLTSINRHTSFSNRVVITYAGSYLQPKCTETVKYEECIKLLSRSLASSSHNTSLKLIMLCHLITHHVIHNLIKLYMES